MTSSKAIAIYPMGHVGQELFVVQSFECGLCDIYDNIKSAIKHRDEMNEECPNDHYWIESWRLRS